MDGRAERGSRGRAAGAPGRRGLGQEQLQAETRIPIPAVGIEDPERRPAAGRAGPAAGDDDIGGLPDHVPAEADPRSAGELEADPRPRPDRGGHRAREPGRLEDEQGDPGPPGEGGEPAEPIGEPGRAIRADRQVQDEEVHGAAGQERPRDRKALLAVGRGEHHEPVRLDTTSHRLDRIEGPGEIQPGHDRAARLGLGGEPEGERRPPAREISPERQAHAPRQPAGPEDGVQGRKPGRVDAGRIRHGLAGPVRSGVPERRGLGFHRERPHDIADDAVSDGSWRSRSPARSEGRERRGHVGGKRRHQVPSIEHLFE
jgi:hypothetical protein